jgi:hypothetical protein
MAYNCASAFPQKKSPPREMPSSNHFKEFDAQVRSDGGAPTFGYPTPLYRLFGRETDKDSPDLDDL